jgi:vancomycin resistance protein VanJ
MRERRRSLRAVTAVVTTAVALTAIATVLLHIGADKTDVGTLLLFAPRRFVPLAWLLVAIVLMWRYRRLAVVAAATSLASLVLFAGFVLPTGTVSTKPRTLRVVSWNVDYPASLEPQLGSALARWNADVVVLQGCTETVAEELQRHRGSTGEVQQLWEFCVLSKLPILDLGHLATRNPNNPQWTRPIALRMRTVADGDTLALLSVHLHSPRQELSRAMRGDLSQLVRAASTREEQAAVVSQRVRDRRWPMLLVGDFNIPPESQIYDRYFGSLTNAFLATGWGFGYTMRAGLLHRLRIDHALVTDDLEVVGFATEPHWPTEHVPLIVDVRRR